MPIAELPPLTPFTDHVTDVLELPLTLAENCCVAPTFKVAVLGLSVTVTVREVF